MPEKKITTKKEVTKPVVKKTAPKVAAKPAVKAVAKPVEKPVLSRVEGEEAMMNGAEPMVEVKRIVKVLGMVNTGPDFTDHSKVMNGYSDMMVAVFGEAGKHARASVGMCSLPFGIAVEVEMIVEVED